MDGDWYEDPGDDAGSSTGIISHSTIRIELRGVGSSTGLLM